MKITKKNSTLLVYKLLYITINYGGIYRVYKTCTLTIKYKNMNEYKKQADNFLLNNNLSLSVQKAVPQKQPEWTKYTGQEHGINYWCILKNIDTKREYGFDFWDSIENKNKNKIPSNYDVLACLDVYEYMDFNDFCDTFGYNNNSISAKNTYNLILEQTAGLKRMLNDKQIQELNEIN